MGRVTSVDTYSAEEQARALQIIEKRHLHVECGLFFGGFWQVVCEGVSENHGLQKYSRSGDDLVKLLLLVESEVGPCLDAPAKWGK